MADDRKLILLTGATGYVGGRLLTELEHRGHRVRCLARRPDHLQGRVAAGSEVVEGDVNDPAALGRALRGVHTAFYLVHSLAAGDDYAERDRRAAHLFARLAWREGVRRIVYLGGLGGGRLSRHLASRQEVGTILRACGVPTIEFRASIIIGSGSLSFEMIRALVEKLPVMLTPRWVRVRAQPIAVEDVIAYLTAACDVPATASRVFEIGGRDRVTYGEIMQEYARQRRLRRLMVPVPLLTPRLSSLWLGLVTPIYARVGRQLVESLRTPTVVGGDDARRVFDVDPRGIREAIARALANEDRVFAATRWSDAMSSSAPSPSWGGRRLGSRIVDSRTTVVPRAAADAFRPIRRIGGAVGWYYADWLWRLRGLLDLTVGGPGTRRGRRDPDGVVPGDTVDFWRVEAIEPDRLLRLHAEMRLPGRAWLQFEVEPDGVGSRIRQTAIFDPLGLAGLLYWYALYPLHALVFRGMLKGIARAAATTR